MSKSVIRAICLMGPTAAGKTEHAIALANRYPVEIISVDSALVYRGMDIGTAKPSPELLADYPHRLVDILDPVESYSAGAFCSDAVAAIQEIAARGRIPLLVGGTMLYFQALQQGIADLPEADQAVRAELDAQAAEHGWPALHEELRHLDPETAARLKPTDAQRIQRALEVCRIAGEPMSALLATTRPPLAAEYLNIGLLPADRSLLHERIAQRLREMIESGVIDEVRRLSAVPGITAETPAMRAVGYRQLWTYVHGENSLEAAAQDALVATRRLAKRQLTWLRSWPDLNAVDAFAVDAASQIDGLVRMWLANGA
jgi:tRNA dimethylallyltransferase